MINIALIFRGSSRSSYEHWQYGDRITVDWQNNIDNLKENLIKPNNCDVFFHTWEENLEESEGQEAAIAKELSAISYRVDESISGEYGKPLGKKVATTAKRGIEVFYEYVEKTQKTYDLIILCRFDLYFFYKVDLKKHINKDCLKDHVFIYGLEANVDNPYIDKQTTEKFGIDDNFIVFTPSALKSYYDALSLKIAADDTIATSRHGEHFYPIQHCSLHHLYYLLDDKIKIKNLVFDLEHTNKNCLFGTIKQISETSTLIRRCPDDRKLKLEEGLFVIRYA